MGRSVRSAALAGAIVAGIAAAHAQTANSPAVGDAAARAPTPTAVTSSYVIGPGDVLGVVFWRERDLSGDVAVLPDGTITLPLLNEIAAAGLTPEQLRLRIVEAARRFVADPTATVVVRQVNSRRVFITGMVAKPGPYPLYQSMTVLQLIATAGGVVEFAKTDQIVIIRPANHRQLTFTFNYKDVSQQKNLHQNIELMPGDTVIVP